VHQAHGTRARRSSAKADFEVRANEELITLRKLCGLLDEGCLSQRMIESAE
jgi:hypothetical protein